MNSRATNNPEIFDDNAIDIDNCVRDSNCLSTILNYLNDDTEYKYQSNLNFFQNLTDLHEKNTVKIATNLVWQIDIDHTLAFAKQKPLYLNNKVKIANPNGQFIEGTPLQIVASEGDRIPGYGLVDRMRDCFPNSEEYYKQLTEWEQRAADETKQTMSPYYEAIKELRDEIRDDKKITSNNPLKTYFEWPCAKKFREALNPKRNHVVKAGDAWDWNIVSHFMELGMDTFERASFKHKLFIAIGFSALQKRASRCDLGLLAMGLNNLFHHGILPPRYDFSKNLPEKLIAMQSGYFFSVEGDMTCYLSGENFEYEMLLDFYSSLMSIKNIDFRKSPRAFRFGSPSSNLTRGSA
jgi:hypothetical protein